MSYVVIVSITTSERHTRDVRTRLSANLRTKIWARGVSNITRNVRMMAIGDNVMSDDIIVGIIPFERHICNRRIGLCRKPRYQIRTPDVSNTTQNVLLTSNVVDAIARDVVVSITTFQ